MLYTLTKFRFILCLLLPLVLTACGGGHSTLNGKTNTASSSVVPGSNVASLIVDSGPAGQYDVNEVFTNVTICDSQAADNCQTIDHILVDTGSSGLRILASAISPSLNLPPELDAYNDNILECGMFADGYTWGPIKRATIELANHIAYSVPVQVIGDPNFTTVPIACSNIGKSENTVSTFDANGVLGIGYFLQDCGATCQSFVPSPAVYYKCSTSSNCTGTTRALSDQVSNPVSMFASDNNGVMISLPQVPSNGETNVVGSLVFGVNSESNNQLGAATIYTVDGNTGNFTTDYNNQLLTSSFIDSGSNALYFNDSTIAACGSFYCPPTTLNLTATIQGTNSVQTSIGFNIADAQMLFNTRNTAFSNLGGGSGGFNNTFDWGLPFFYGRKVFVVFQGKSDFAGNIGPYVAF